MNLFGFLGRKHNLAPDCRAGLDSGDGSPNASVRNDPAPSGEQSRASNVVEIPFRSSNDTQQSGIRSDTSPGSLTAKQAFSGGLNSPELKAFFSENHFGLGRHNGATYRTQDALERGHQQVVSKFRNAVARVIAQRQADINRLRDCLLQVDGVSKVTSARLQSRCEAIVREIADLVEQVDLAEDGKGWVLEALNNYQVGFHMGVREALDFELLIG